MNDKARRIYEYIVDRISHDISPTVREICSDLGIKSTSTVHRYINELCEEGLLEKRGNSNRSLQLAGDDGAARVPLIGKVTAGMPITAFECREGYVPFDCGRERVEDLFALRIQGDSMINAGIFGRGRGDWSAVSRWRKTEKSSLPCWTGKPPASASTKKTDTSGSSRKTTSTSPSTPKRWRCWVR